MRLVKFTSTNGAPVYVNPEHVTHVAVKPAINAYYTEIGTIGTVHAVMELIEEVTSKLSNSGEETKEEETRHRAPEPAMSNTNTVQLSLEKNKITDSWEETKRPLLSEFNLDSYTLL